MFNLLICLLATIFVFSKLYVLPYGVLIFCGTGLIGNLLTVSYKEEKKNIEQLKETNNLNIELNNKTIILNYLIQIAARTIFWPGHVVLIVWNQFCLNRKV